MREQILEMEGTVAFLGAAVADGEQAAKPPPAGAVARIGEDVGRAIGEHEARARVITQLETALAFGDVRPHHAGDRIAVGKPEARKAEMLRLTHQLLGMGGAAQEGEVRGDGELDIRGHGTRLFIYLSSRAGRGRRAKRGG